MRGCSKREASPKDGFSFLRPCSITYFKPQAFVPTKVTRMSSPLRGPMTVGARYSFGIVLVSDSSNEARLLFMFIESAGLTQTSEGFGRVHRYRLYFLTTFYCLYRRTSWHHLTPRYVQRGRTNPPQNPLLRSAQKSSGG